MKITFTIILCMIYFSSLSQNEKIKDTCSKKRPLPCKLKEPYKEAVVDTITANEFSNIINDLYEKMDRLDVLNKTEDSILVMLMNTYAWTSFDKQDHIDGQFPKLILIHSLFDKSYDSYLYCKYTTCFGGGVGTYFVELGIQYIGNPFLCSRFFIRN